MLGVWRMGMGGKSQNGGVFGTQKEDLGISA